MITNKRTLLTPRELAVYNHLETGLLYKEIADKLGITIDTVKKHCKNIYAKMGVRNRTEAVVIGTDFLKNFLRTNNHSK
jgi:DNA-binding CsgD family transcriptional regulator